MNMTSTVGVPAVLSGTTADLERELFHIAVRGLAEGTGFYQDTDERFIALVAHLALADDGWLVRFIGWLRSYDELASAAVVAATEMVRTRLAARLTTSRGNRNVISSVLLRADEPGELLGYWFRRYGRSVPNPIRNGLADAARNLYDEKALATYDLTAQQVRFADVISLVHPKAATRDQKELFYHVIARRENGSPIPASLAMLRARADLYAVAPQQRQELLDRPDAAQTLAAAGMTYGMLDRWLLNGMDARAWAAILPSLSYRDLLASLRALDECGLSEEIPGRVGALLSDTGRVVRERVLPLRLHAADRTVPSRRWGWALEQAMEAALAQVPALPGRTLILIDRSASMFTQVDRGSAVTVADQATVFGTALALQARSADLVQFGTAHRQVTFSPGEPLFSLAERFGEMGDGDAAAAVRQRYDGHDRVVIVTDEPDGSAWQGEHPAAALPDHVPSYIWNVASASNGGGESMTGARRHVFSGLTDGAFTVIPLVEGAYRNSWPF
jgi:hypothetical protein